MGKGSNRRPSFVPDNVVRERWPMQARPERPACVCGRLMALVSADKNRWECMVCDDPMEGS